MKTVEEVTIKYQLCDYEEGILLVVVTMGDREWVVEYYIEEGLPLRPSCRCREDDFEIWNTDHQPYCPIHFLYAGARGTQLEVRAEA